MTDLLHALSNPYAWLMVALAYALGSLSFAVIVSGLMRLPNPHTYGSGNPGATNVLRSGNKTAAILTLLLDAAKGWLVVFIAQRLQADATFNLTLNLSNTVIAAAALAVFLGHLFPMFYRFKGGKGVATAAGVLIGVHPLLGAATVVTWVAMAACFRYSSLAALVSAVFAAVYTFIWFGVSPISAAMFIMSALLMVRHKTNIQKLLAGQESKIGAKKSAS
jgi:acyl phosphate:glycerol-3-phosphate acyltransferase